MDDDYCIDRCVSFDYVSNDVEFQYNAIKLFCFDI